MNIKMSYITTFCVSLSILAVEILFVRIFAIYGWQNYISIIISIALLGFGFSGTVITIFKKYIIEHFVMFNIISFFLYIISLMISFILYCIIPFNPFEVLWNPVQIIFLILHFIIFLMPFTSGPVYIGIQFLADIKISKLYFYNLSGSGIGVVIILILLNVFHPVKIFIFLLLFLILLLFFIILIYLINKSIKKRLIFILGVLILLILIFNQLIKNDKILKISQYKGISGALKLPNSKILSEKYSPLGLIQVIEADGYRSVSGLSYNFMGNIPVQKAIFFDGDSSSAIAPFKNKKDIEYLAYTTSSVPYYLLENKEKSCSLIVGAGGGEGILRSVYFEIKDITGLEVNNNVISLMKNDFAEISGDIYNYENIKIINKDISEYINKADNKFDIIDISLMDSFNASTSGVYSLNENYLYTVESFMKLYSLLSDEGIISITRWTKFPPRDNLKLFLTAVNMFEKLGVDDYKKKAAFIRSGNTATLCISKKIINTVKIRQFCNDMSFDLIYVYDINENEVNLNFILEKPYYYEACKKILSADREKFINDYPFNINVSTDNNPYFYNFLKINTIKYLFKNNIKNVPFTEWGYFILIVVLIPILIISCILIIFPLLFIRKKIKIRINESFIILLYFFIIGIGFFFLEIPLLQKFIQFLHNPTYSASIIISSLLIFTGIGSLLSDKIFKNKIIVFPLICLIIIIYLLFISILFNFLMGFHLLVKIIITFILVGIPGFFLGFPFPLVLSQVKKIDNSIVPWAWGVNGFASVISSILAVILSINFGFNFVFISAVVLYILTGGIFFWIYKNIIYK